MKRTFTDFEVRAIKANLVKGVSIVVLARMHECNPETISRMKRGLTHRHIKVVGEEGLRPEITVVPAQKEDLRVMSGVTDEEAQASQERFLAELAKETASVKAVREVDAGLKERMRQLGYE